MNMKLEIFDPLFDLSLWMTRQAFVVWRKPGEQNHNGFKATFDILSEGSFPFKDSFVFSPFNTSGKYPSIAFYPIEDDLDNGSGVHNPKIPVFIPKDIPDLKADYCKRIDLLIGLMKDSLLHKCVLSRRIDFNGPDESLAPDLFMELCKKYPNAFVSLIHIPGVFTWLGATPERLLKVKEQKAHTTALAATRPFKGVLPDISEWNEKEKEEQQLVTDFILKVLQDEEIGSIQCEGPRSAQAGNLVHLKTDIHFSLTPKTNILSLMKALHPTPAVCGIPKEEALKKILSLEPHDREYYAGYMGTISKEEMELYVNLRCMRWVGGKPSLFVGGGITAASVSEQEWEETNFKAHTLLDVIEKICNLAGKNPDAH
jgi:isochorismate synthase